MSEDMSEQQAEHLLRQFADSKTTIQKFFSDVIKTADTTKTGNLTQDELGTPKLPLRTYKELALFSKDVYGDSEWENFFNSMSEIQTSTSLSKDAILLKLVVTQKKELADLSPSAKAQPKENKGWFKKKK